MRFAALFIFLTAFAANPVFAYVGPGPGLTMLGSLVGLVSSVVIAVLMLLLWPARLYYKKMKARKANPPRDDMPPSL